MKYLIATFLLLSALHLSAQTGLNKAEAQIKNFARFCASHEWATNNFTNNSRIEKTHTLDSIVNFDGGGNYIGKSEVVYDSQLRTSTIHQYGLDSAQTSVMLQIIFELEYGSIDLPSKITERALNTDNQQIETAAIFDLFYDGMERVDSLVLQSLDPFSGLFIPLIASKQVFSGNLLVQSRQWFYISLFGSWVPSSRTEYVYDGQDRLIETETTMIDFFTLEEIPESRTTYSYNTEGQQDIITDYIWTDTIWDPAQKFLREYYGNGTLSSETRQIFSSGTWVNNVWRIYHVEKVTDAYPYTSYIWDEIDGAWEKTDSVINLLNPALPFEKVVLPTELSVLDALGGPSEPPFMEEGPSVDEIQYFYFDTLALSFDYTGSDVYYYSLIKGSAIHEALPDFIKVSPNPANDQFNVELDLESTGMYTVFSNGAVALKKGELNEGHNTIFTSGWLPGTYFVLIQLHDGNVYVHKQIIE